MMMTKRRARDRGEDRENVYYLDQVEHFCQGRIYFISALVGSCPQLRAVSCPTVMCWTKELGFMFLTSCQNGAALSVGVRARL